MNMTPLKIGIFIGKIYIYPILATTLSTFSMFHKSLLANVKTCCSKCIGNIRSFSLIVKCQFCTTEKTFYNLEVRVDIAMLPMQNLSSQELINIKNIVFYLFDSKNKYIYSKYKYI